MNPKAAAVLNSEFGKWAALGIVGALVLVYGLKKAGGVLGEAAGAAVIAAGDAAAAVGAAVNPASQTNIVYRGVNKAGEVITGQPEWSLGVWAWEVLHPNEKGGK